MSHPSEFYKLQIDIHAEELQKVKRKLAVSSTIRLVVFLLACAGVYFFFENTKIVIAIIVLAIVAFVYLVTKHSDLQYKRELKKAHHLGGLACAHSSKISDVSVFAIRGLTVLPPLEECSRR